MKKQKKLFKKTKVKVIRLSEKVDKISIHINVLKTRLEFAEKNKLEDRKVKLTKVLEKTHKKLVKTQSKYTRTVKNASKKKHVIKLIKSKGLVKRFKHVVRSVITKIRLVKITIVSIQTIIVKKTILIEKYIKQIKTMPKKSVKAQAEIAYITNKISKLKKVVQKKKQVVKVKKDKIKHKKALVVKIKVKLHRAKKVMRKSVKKLAKVLQIHKSKP